MGFKHMYRDIPSSQSGVPARLCFWRFCGQLSAQARAPNGHSMGCGTERVVAATDKHEPNFRAHRMFVQKYQWL